MYEFLLVRHCNYRSILYTICELFDVEEYRDLEIWLRSYRSLNVIETGAIRKLGCGFLFAFHSNYGRIFNLL